jgi:hypothetical protein
VASFASNSNFNELAVVARQQMARNLNFNASYELSKSLDNNSGFFPSDGSTALYADSRNRALDYGPSSFDIRNRIIASFVFKLPSARNGSSHIAKGAFAHLIEDWTTSGITNIRSGFPFTVRASSDTDFTGLNRWSPATGFSDRVDINPGVTMVPRNMSDPDHAFDPRVFSFPKAGRPGTARRNSLVGPHSISQDFALMRDFSVRESELLQLRVESFNVFNHTNFALPENRLDQSSVGKIGASYDPRLLQLSLHFQW